MQDNEQTSRFRAIWDRSAPVRAAIAAALLVLVLAPRLVPALRTAPGSAVHGVERGRWASVESMGPAQLDPSEALLRMRRPPDSAVRWSGAEWERESWEGQVLPRFGCDRNVWPERFVPIGRVLAAAKAAHPALPGDVRPEEVLVWELAEGEVGAMVRVAGVDAAKKPWEGWIALTLPAGSWPGRFGDAVAGVSMPQASTSGLLAGPAVPPAPPPPPPAPATSPPAPAAALAAAPVRSSDLRPQTFELERGSGYAAQAGDGIEMHYRCFEIGGKYSFDSRSHWKAPVMNAGKSFPAEFGKALIGVRQGSRLLIVVPDAYVDSPTEAKAVGLEPSTDLLFEVTVTGINPASTSGKRAAGQADAGQGGRSTW